MEEGAKMVINPTKGTETGKVSYEQLNNIAVQQQSVIKQLEDQLKQVKMQMMQLHQQFQIDRLGFLFKMVESGKFPVDMVTEALADIQEIMFPELEPTEDLKVVED